MKALVIVVSLIITGSFQASSQEFVSMEYLTSYEREYIITNFGAPAAYDTDLYKVRYTSVDLEGNPDTLSGLLALPDTEDLAHPLMVYAHGTVASRESVPSRLSSEHFLVAIFGSLGYVSLGPDYLGLGDSEGLHPYVHADSEAWACYDMIKAIRTSSDENGFDINDQNFIFGYSQGGHSAMALQRFMELENPDGYKVTASAPSSGPYSISEEMVDFTLGESQYFTPAFLPYTALSYHEVYGNILENGDLRSFFKEEYVPDMELFRDEVIDLFDLNDRLINRLIANHGMSLPRLMIQENILNDILNNPDSPVSMALADNDVYDWAPQAPTRLYYCSGDDVVGPGNSVLADATMNANGGADIASLDLGETSNHGQCVPSALTLTIFFFDSYKNITSNTYAPPQDNELNVFPNPANGIVYIKSKNTNKTFGTVEVLDIAGRRLMKAPWTENDPIDVSSLDGGHYILLLNTDQQVEVHRLVITD
ncbi:MAG: T9SS type A sorting domain-containing protein [Saprospiraceae bacterium]|nr:T9SS type A sorting domain-containing protein [Saprospiraceae bacterium]